MANVTIWQINAQPKWYTKLEHRLWTSLEVTFGVWPVAFGHNAGVVWTIDDWRTTKWDAAKWERNVINPYGGYDEQWRAIMNMGPSPYPLEFCYALYVEDSERIKYWDNNRGQNYEKVI